MKTKLYFTLATIALCTFAACSDDSSSSANPTGSGNHSDSSNTGNSCTEKPMTAEEMKPLLESFNFPTTTSGTETIDSQKPMYKVSHNEFCVAACDTTYPAIMQADGWEEEASLTVGSGNFVSFVGYRYTKKIGCTDISIAFICRDGIEGGTTNFYVEYLKNARNENISVGTYE